MKKLKKTVLIFDVDGVIIDSKANMSFSWAKVQEKHFLYSISFNKYFENIGRPFFDILKNLGIKRNFNKIRKTYEEESIKKKNMIKYYDEAILTLKTLYKKNFILNIVTSKDLKRTKKFLNKNIKLFNSVECNDKKIGKPDPYQINKIIKKLKVDKKNCVYIGDTHIDYLTAKNAKIDFIFAMWGYGKNYNYKYKCQNFNKLNKFINK